MTEPRPAKPSREQFEDIRLIGEGNFCEVLHVVRHTPPEERAAELLRKKENHSFPSDFVTDFALKCISKEKVKKLRKEAEVVMEKECLLKLNDLAYRDRHPGWNNIIKLYFTTSDPFNLYLLTEFCPDGELWTLTSGVGVLDEQLCRCYAAQVVNALEYMHSRGILHRDLKAENILLGPDGRLKVIDFGTARDIERPELKLAGNHSGSPLASKTFDHFVGTANFMPPEALKNRSAGRSGDLWSLGATLFQIAAGKPPFEAPSDFLTHLLSTNLVLEVPPHFPASLEDLVRSLMRIDPQERLGAADHDLAAVKSHAYFAGTDWADPAGSYRRAEGRQPLPSLATLCYAHMSREWARFEEKWQSAGWLPAPRSFLDEDAAADDNAYEEFRAPSLPRALEEKSRKLLANFAPEARPFERLVWWKELDSKRGQPYWDGVVQRFMAGGGNGADGGRDAA